MFKKLATGFTLLEILIALFIFTMIAMILMQSLHQVINAVTRTEQRALELRQTQMGLLVLSRNIEQIVDRPVWLSGGKRDLSFIGTPTSMTFTHGGYANPLGTSVQSNMQRMRFFVERDAIWSMVWPVLDAAPTSHPHARRLLEKVDKVRFRYVDRDGRFHDDWPVAGKAKETLPQAISVSFVIPSWGKMSQFYVIPSKSNETPTPPPPT